MANTLKNDPISNEALNILSWTEDDRKKFMEWIAVCEECGEDFKPSEDKDYGYSCRRINCGNCHHEWHKELIKSKMAARGVTDLSYWGY